jgi:hypothetical protein
MVFTFVVSFVACRTKTNSQIIAVTPPVADAHAWQITLFD